MKRIILIAFMLMGYAYAQYTPMTAAGYQFKRIVADSTLHLPSFCGIPTLRNSSLKNGALAIDTCGQKVYFWTNGGGWAEVTGTALDTTSLSNRINLKVNIADTGAMLTPYLKKQDTSAMLSKYLRKTDTASLSNRINLKLSIADTASMLSKYLRKTDTASLSNRINLKLSIADTASMLSKYLRKTDTASLSNRINLKLSIADTATMLSKYLRKTDTASLSNRINLKLAISDTTNKWVNNVTKKNDSTITIFKGNSATDITLPKGSAGTIPTLQQVTTAGAISSNNITVQSGTSQSAITNSYFYASANSNNNQAYYYYDKIQWAAFPNYRSTQLAPILNGQHIYQFYDSNTIAATIDTIATLKNIRNISTGSGTVTSVATGYGLSGGTITTSGTLLVDTATLSTKYARLGETQNGRFGNDTATIVMAKVHNDAGVQLTNGKVVYLSSSGTSSDVPSVKLANNKADSSSANTFGFVSGTINANDTGWIILSGKIEKLNTSAFSNGDIIYLDSVSGNYTKTKPSAPYHMVYLGVVVKANAGNGSIFVKCQNGYELDEIHDVAISGKVNNNILVYSDTQKVWKNRSIYSVVDTTNTIATKTNVAAKVNISDTAAMLSSYQVKGAATVAYLGSDFTTTSTTAANTNLSIAVSANTAYRIMISGSASKATSSTGMKISIGAPTGTTIKALAALGGNAISTITNSFISSINSLGSTFATGVGVEVPFRVEGILVTGANAGNIVLQAATVTSNTATIYANTLMTITPAYAQ